METDMTERLRIAGVFKSQMVILEHKIFAQ